MHVSHEEQPGMLEKVLFGVVMLSLVVVSMLGVVLWTTSSTDNSPRTTSIHGQDRAADMDAADTGLRRQEEWENANRDIELTRVSQMDAADATRRMQEQIELQFPMGNPGDQASDGQLDRE